MRRVEELVLGLESLGIASDSEQMVARLAERVPSIPIEDLNSIVDVVYALYHVREFSELKRSAFLDELVEAVRGLADPPLSDAQVPRIRTTLHRLLSIKTLESISNAIALQRDGERLYCNTKILSDIRPVFGDDVEAPPVAAVITHTLKLGYHEAGNHKEFFVVLNQQDLDKFQATIERAQSKTKTLEKTPQDSKLPKLGIYVNFLVRGLRKKSLRLDRWRQRKCGRPVESRPSRTEKPMPRLVLRSQGAL